MTKKDPLVVHSVLMSKDRFNLRTAKAWIRKHDFKLTHYGKPPHETENYYRFRQIAPGRFKQGSFVTGDITDGVKFVYGNLKSK